MTGRSHLGGLGLQGLFEFLAGLAERGLCRGDAMDGVEQTEVVGLPYVEGSKYSNVALYHGKRSRKRERLLG
jgi:hypothetical protein